MVCLTPPPLLTPPPPGLIWYVWFERLIRDMEQDDPDTVRKLSAPMSMRGGGGGIPYRAILRSRPVHALMFTHFCNNWCVRARTSVLRCVKAFGLRFQGFIVHVSGFAVSGF